MSEPYGYVWTSLKDCMETRFSHFYPNKFYNPTDIIPVYTHPIRELTDDEIKECCKKVGVIIHTDYVPSWIKELSDELIKESRGEK